MAETKPMRKLILASAMLFAFSTTLYAQDVEYCRAEIEGNPKNDLSYRNRGDRCEGLFIKKISQTGLRLIGYHMHPAQFSSSDEKLIISIGSPKIANLTMVSTRSYMHYRMDTHINRKQFELPLSLIHHPQIAITSAEVGALACIEKCDSLRPHISAVSFGEDDTFRPYVLFVSDEDLHQLEIKITVPDTGDVLFEKDLLRGRPAWRAGRVAEFGLKKYLADHSSVVLGIIARGRNINVVDAIEYRLSRQD